MEEFSLDSRVQITAITSGTHHFFGYYDKCPWSADGRRLLAHEADFIDRLPNGEEIACIGYFDLEKGTGFQKVAETRAWNWQQGSMLQWLGPSFDKLIIFNDLRDGKFVSVIFNIETRQEEKVIPFPVYAVHPDGTSALSLDFALLDEVREGYGYKGGDINPDDCIYSFNLWEEKPVKERIIYNFNVLRFKPLNYSDNERHWVDHITFNPSGGRFAFFHRWQVDNNGLYSQLCWASKSGKTIVTAPQVLLDSGMASHFSWFNNEEVVAWGRLPESKLSRASNKFAKNRVVRKLLLPMYHLLSPGLLKQKISGDSFIRFNIKSILPEGERVGEGLLTEDGHVSFSPDKQWLLTDTFDRKNHSRGLLLYHLRSKRKLGIDSFPTIPHGPVAPEWDSSVLRCDLHPRWNRDGTQICFDSVHKGTRQMYIADVRKIVNSYT